MKTSIRESLSSTLVDVTVKSMHLARTYAGRQCKGSSYKTTWCIEVRVDDTTVVVPLSRAEHALIYRAVLELQQEGKRLGRREFQYSYDCGRDLVKKVQAMYKDMHIGKDARAWWQIVSDGRAHRIDDAKSKINGALRKSLRDAFGDDYYDIYNMVALNVVDDHSRNSHYEILAA